jgi:hypothetical protein
LLKDAVAKLTTKKSSAEQDSKDVNPNTHGKNRGNSGRTSSKPQMETLCNMGAYCHSHGFHPVGHNHNSKRCTRIWTTTRTMLLGPTEWRVACTGTLPSVSLLNNKNDATWKEKAPTTN